MTDLIPGNRLIATGKAIIRGRATVNESRTFLGKTDRRTRYAEEELRSLQRRGKAILDHN